MLVKITFAWALLALCVGIVRGEHSIMRYLELRKTRTVLRDTVNNLDQENATLEKEIAKIKNSPSYAEKVLRDKYHITKQGERIIFFAE
ncbi:MAG: septum formation initiator family protein [Oligoflexales bacterium]